VTCPICGAHHLIPGVCCDPAVEDDEQDSIILSID
jgi:hypothetical protein